MGCEPSVAMNQVFTYGERMERGMLAGRKAARARACDRRNQRRVIHRVAEFIVSGRCT